MLPEPPPPVALTRLPDLNKPFQPSLSIMLTNFNYSPLGRDEIRLVRLSAKTTNSSGKMDSNVNNDMAEQPLHFKLQHFERSGCPKYIALSYAWGIQRSEKEIIVEDQKCYISLTVEEALRRLQSETLELLVWVDQICINKADDEEKSHQVRQMRLIYSEAAEVVVWIGPDADDCSVLFHYLQDSLAAYNAKDYETLFSLYSDKQRRSVITKAWRRFCERSYWTRLWIIQEYAVASRVRIACGAAVVLNFVTTHPLVLIQHIQEGKIEIPEKFKPENLKNAIINMYRNPATSFMEAVITRRQRHYYIRGKGEDIFFRVLVSTLVLEVDHNYPLSTDPRDRIFAILQLSDDADEFKPFLDYGKSCEAVYTETALIMFKQGHVDLLSYCQFPKRIPNLPSWAPDWSMEVRTPCASSPWINWFSASGDTAQRQILRVLDSETISLRGFAVDCIATTGILWDPNWLRPINASAAMAYLKEVQAFCQRSPKIAKHDKLHATARVAVQDVPRRKEEDSPSWPDRILNSYLQAIKVLELDEQQTPVEAQAAEDTLDLQAHLYIRLLRGLHSRRLFISLTGYVGLCPQHTKPEDQICVFFGSKIAYILRPRSGGAFQLVGEAYVYGIMQGELLNGKIDEMEFVIR